MKTLAFILLSFLTFENSITASHGFGGELTYKCLGSGNYMFTLILYRDCSNLTPPLLTISSTNSCNLTGGNFLLTQVGGPEIITTCPNTCNGGFAFGVEKYTYQGIITLPGPCSDWYFYTSFSARVPIQAFLNSDSYNFYLEATLNNTNGICDTSPVFSNNPLIEACVNQPYCIDPGIIDAEGDSVVTSFVPLKENINQTVPYAPGYSLLYPMALNAPLSIINPSGMFCFTALATVTTAYVLQTTEYRNGIPIGQVERDINLHIITCPPSQPAISGINGGLSSDTTVCANSQLCFDIFTTDQVSSDSTKIVWDNNIPLANFTVTSVQNESASFCWHPTNSDINILPHCFKVRTRDNACPTYQSDEKIFCITVVDSATCATLGFNEMSQTGIQFNIYPQPSKDFINVELKNISQPLTFYIQDIFGKIIFEKHVIENKFNINSELLKPGIYFATVKSNNGAIIKSVRLIKINN